MDFNEFLIKVDNWDKKNILKYNGIGGESFTLFLRFLSFFGRETIWLCLITYFFFIWYDPLIFSQISTTFLFGVFLIAPIKRFIARSRPFESNKEINILEPKPTSRSFPSWHAYNVISQGLLFSFIFNNPFLTTLFISLSILISFSRIQLGAHYPSDVIVGFFLGIAGFYVANIILTPIMLSMISFFEQFVILEIHYKTYSPYLFEIFWYGFSVLAIYIIIFLIAFYKRIKNMFKAKN